MNNIAQKSILMKKWIPLFLRRCCSVFQTEAPQKKIAITSKDQKRLQNLTPDHPPDSKLLKVAIIGSPNAGKSTLANKLMGWRYTAVSKKVHTTRSKALGVLTKDSTQIVFLDTPGMLVPWRMKPQMERSLLTDPHSGLIEADLIAVVVDVAPIWNRTAIESEILKVLSLHQDKETILVLNKVDLIKHKKDLLNISRLLTQGVVANRQNWTTDKKKENKLDLDDMFEKTAKKHLSSKGKLDNIQKSEELLTDYEKIICRQSETETKDNDELKSDLHAIDTNNADFIQETKTVSQISNDELVTNNSYRNIQCDDMSIDNANEIHLNGTDSSNNYNNKEFETEPLKVESNTESNSIQGHAKPSPQVEIFYTEDGEEIKVCVDVFQDEKLEENCDNDRDNEIITVSKQAFNLDSKEDWDAYASLLKAAEEDVKDMKGWPHFSKVFYVSAKSGDGVHDIVNYLFQRSYPSPWMYHQSFITDQDPKEIARMTVWEKLLDHLPNEIPYEIDIKLINWVMDESNILRVQFDLICSKKRFLYHTLGKEGKAIRTIAMEAKQELMNTFRTEVSLQLVVKATSRLKESMEKRQKYLNKQKWYKKQQKELKAEKNKA